MFKLVRQGWAGLSAYSTCMHTTRKELEFYHFLVEVDLRYRAWLAWSPVAAVAHSRIVIQVL